jgi:tetratricopeptide (TPR) repeat protein
MTVSEARVLNKAARLLRQKKYGDVIRMLEPKVPLYYHSFKFYYLLGSACLYASDFGGAIDYFKSARNIKLRDPSVLLAFALLYLRRGETDRAVDLYLEVQEVDEHNETARKALKIIRKFSRTDTLVDWIESGKLSSLYPPLPAVSLSPGDILFPVAGGLIALVVVGGLLIAFNIIEPPFQTFFKKTFQTNADRNGLISSSLDAGEQKDPVQTGGAYRYILTRSQILSDYEEARTLFTKYRDESAKVLLNRIIESNASESIKTKAAILISYMDVPGFDTLKDRIAYREVMKDPLLYRDCYVIWKGMATNLSVEQNATSFDFLVGYDTRKTLEGIVRTAFSFSVGVNPEVPLEILGKIVPSENGDGLTLEGNAVHQSGLLEAAR